MAVTPHSEIGAVLYELFLVEQAQSNWVGVARSILATHHGLAVQVEGEKFEFDRVHSCEEIWMRMVVKLPSLKAPSRRLAPFSADLRGRWLLLHYDLANHELALRDFGRPLWLTSVSLIDDFAEVTVSDGTTQGTMSVDLMRAEVAGIPADLAVGFLERSPQMRFKTPNQGR